MRARVHVSREPAVLKGMEDSLFRKKIDMVQFEYHWKWFDPQWSLRRVVEYLDRLQYDCFLVGAKLSLALTTENRSCTFHNNKVWSNVIAIGRHTGLRTRVLTHARALKG